jgi:hypothetical protein
MTDLYGNQTGRVYGGIAPTSEGRRRGGSNGGITNGNGAGNGSIYGGQGGLYGSQDQMGLESVPGSPMSLTSGMSQYYGYGGDQNYYGSSGMYVPRSTRGNKVSPALQS